MSKFKTQTSSREEAKTNENLKLQILSPVNVYLISDSS